MKEITPVTTIKQMAKNPHVLILLLVGVGLSLKSLENHHSLSKR
jgi:hypothetical protein